MSAIASSQIIEKQSTTPVCSFSPLIHDTKSKHLKIKDPGDPPNPTPNHSKSKSGAKWEVMGNVEEIWEKSGAALCSP